MNLDLIYPLGMAVTLLASAFACGYFDIDESHEFDVGVVMLIMIALVMWPLTLSLIVGVFLWKMLWGIGKVTKEFMESGK